MDRTRDSGSRDRGSTPLGGSKITKYISNMITPLGSLDGQTLKKGFKKLFFPILLCLVIVVVFLKFSELKEIGKLFMTAKWYWLVLAFICQVLNFSLQATVYHSSLKTLKFIPLPFWRLIRCSITMVFLNYSVPSLGFAGNLWFLKQLRKHNVQEGKALMVVMIEFICFYVAFIILLLLSTLYLFFKLGHVGYTQKIAMGGFGLIVLVIAGAIYFFLGNKQRAKKRVLWVVEKIDQAEDGVHQEARIHQLLEDFYQDFRWLKQNKQKVALPVLLQFTKFLTDGLNIYLIFLAFGLVTPIGLGIVGFAFGRLFGSISLIPGGLGATEGSMVLIFNSLGIQLELALAVMLIYRFFSYWIYFPLGLFFYRHLNDKEG